MPDMRETTTREPASLDEDALVFEASPPPFAHPRTRRQRLARGAGAASVIALTSFLVLGGPGGVLALIGTLRTPAAASPAVSLPALRLPPLRDVSLPAGAVTAAASSTLWISPAGGGHADVYACWTQPGQATAQAGIPPADAPNSILHLAVLSAGGNAWRSLAPPLTRASQCLIATDAADGSSLLLGLNGTAADAAGTDANCPPPALYLSPDGGASWSPVPWPAPHLVVCTARIALMSGRIYIHADNPLLPTAQIPPGGHGRLITSDDLGASWHAADVGLPDVDSFGLISLRQGGHLLAETFDNQHPGAGTLWESGNAGAFWRSLGPLPGVFPQVYVSSDPTQVANGGWGRIYVSAQTPGGASDAGRSTLVATGWPDTPWTPLAVPPTPGMGEPDVGQIVTAAVGPASALLVLRIAAPDGQSTFAPPLDIWLWAPAPRHWRAADFLLPAGSTPIPQGTSWSGGVLHLWFLHMRMGTQPSADLVELDVPPGSVG